MQYVQSWPPVVEPVPYSSAVKPVWHVNAVHKVAERILPPLIHRSPSEMPAQPAINRRAAPYAQTVEYERRKLCRRIHATAVLEELRSGQDRRRRNQRRDDFTTAIDEKI